VAASQIGGTSTGSGGGGGGGGNRGNQADQVDGVQVDNQRGGVGKDAVDIVELELQSDSDKKRKSVFKRKKLKKRKKKKVSGEGTEENESRTTSYSESSSSDMKKMFVFKNKNICLLSWFFFIFFFFNLSFQNKSESNAGLEDKNGNKNPFEFWNVLEDLSRINLDVELPLNPPNEVNHITYPSLNTNIPVLNKRPPVNNSGPFKNIGNVTLGDINNSGHLSLNNIVGVIETDLDTVEDVGLDTLVGNIICNK
jgi:hypothetical protein